MKLQTNPVWWPFSLLVIACCLCELVERARMKQLVVKRLENIR